MEILQIILLIAILGLIGGGIYYYSLIMKFKRLILFEQKIPLYQMTAAPKKFRQTTLPISPSVGLVWLLCPFA